MKRLMLFTCLLMGLFSANSQHKSFEVEVSGTGQPVIYLPGFTCPGDVWDETIAQLEGDYQSYQFTYAGFAKVPAIGIPWYSTLSEEIAAFIESENIQDAIIIGHSMGGMIAIDIAAKFPDRISKMIMVDAIPCIRALIMPQYSSEQIVFDNPYNQQMLAASDSAMRVTAGYMAQGMSNQPEKQSEIAGWIMESDRKTYVYGYTELLKLDLREKLATIPTETLILGADYPSKAEVTETFESQFTNLKNKDIKIASDSKHFIMFDQPAWFYSEVNAFLK